MSEDILLIPSGNGLGHARRLVAIYNQFQLQDVSCSILLSEKQNRLCSDEMTNSKAGKVIISDLKFGLDGPFTNAIVSAPSDALIERFSAARAIISDNVLWPSKYNDNVFLHGHFSWIDYWKQPHLIPPLEFQTELESTPWKNIRGWFKTSFLSFPETILEVNQFPMPLIRYCSDDKFLGYERRWDEAWVSVGTTGDPEFSKTDILEMISKNMVLRYLETFQFHYKRVLPGIVIGRPGAGTLRDCLSSNTLFISNFEGTLDPELRNNWAIMKKEGLSSPDLNMSTSQFKRASSKYEQVWPHISAPIEEYVDKMLSIISEVAS